MKKRGNKGSAAQNTQNSLLSGIYRAFFKMDETEGSVTSDAQNKKRRGSPRSPTNTSPTDPKKNPQIKSLKRWFKSLTI